MVGNRHERRGHFRGKARPGRVLPVRFRVDGETSSDTPWVASETKNVGTGGAFIASSEALAAGTAIILELVLPTNERTFQLPAVVRWNAPDGMGVQFVNVDVDVLLELNDYFSTLTGQS